MEGFSLSQKQTIRQALTVMSVSTSPQVTETRTGPLGCSNYDNLDTVSSVLVHSPENKVQLQGNTQDRERSRSGLQRFCVLLRSKPVATS